MRVTVYKPIMTKKTDTLKIKNKKKKGEDVSTEEQELLAELKLGQNPGYKDYVKEHKKRMKRLENEALGIFEPEDDY